MKHRRSKIAASLHRLLAASILALCAPMICAQINTEQMMRTGRYAMGFEDYILAIQYFNEAIGSKPYLPEPYLMRAIAKYYLEDYTGAEADATKTLEINRFFTDALEVRGASRMSLRKYANAEQDYAALLEQQPDNKLWIFNHALSLANLDRYEEADSALTALIEKQPSFENAYLMRGNVRLERKDTVAAIADIEKALEINANSFNGHVLRYQLALNFEKDDKKALNSLDQLIKLRPKETDLYITRANLRYRDNDYFGAMADYTYALQLDPDNEVATYNRALLRTEVLDIDNALYDYSKLIELDPDNDFARYQRAMIYANKGRYREAIDDITKFIQLYPTLATSYFVRSQWLLALGDTKRAKADYDKATGMASSNRPIRRQKHRMSNLEKKYEESKNAANEPETEVLTPEEFEKRLNKPIEVDPETNFEVQYENSNIRGKIQNKNFDVEIEPLMQLSLYITPSELKQKTYYMKEVDELNDTRLLRSTLYVTNRPPVSATMEEVDEHFESVEYYNSYISSHKPRAIDYVGRALELMTLRNPSGAIVDLNRAIELTPDYALAYLLRAQARFFDTTTDQPRSTILRLVAADIDKALELSPHNAIAWYNKGNLAFESGDYTSAILAYTKAIEEQPDMGEAYFNRGYSNLKLGNPDRGIADLSKAGELGIVPAYNVLKRINK